MKYRVDMFNKFPMTKDEIDFVKNVDASGGMNMSSFEVHNILANYYLAKQIEASSISNDKSSRKMFWLTMVIGVFGVAQVIELVFKLFGYLN